MSNQIHTCACGQEVIGLGWNGVGTILRCQACTEKRQSLLRDIREAIQGRNVDMVKLPMSARDLVTVNDLPVDISYGRLDSAFEVVEE